MEKDNDIFTNTIAGCGDKMKKCFFTLGILFVIFFCSVLTKWTFVQLFYAEPAIMQTSISPDGKHTAYVFESNGGATSGWTYHISIVQDGKKLRKGNGNIYISDIPPKNIMWIDNSTMFVDDYDSAGTTKRREKMHNITIQYQSLEKKDSILK